ncbi:MAG TPA: type II CAAX endopeptidase family protein [Terrimicrobium sp.]
MELLFSGVLSLGSAVYFSRLAMGSDPQSQSRGVLQPYGIADGIFAALLVIWFLTNILGSATRVVVVNTRLLIAGAILWFLLATFLLSFLIARSRNPLDLFGLREAGWQQILKSGCWGLAAALPAIYFVHTLSLHLLGPDAHPQPLLQFLAGNPSLQDKLLLVFTALVIAPIAEELIFRGYLFGVLRRYAGRWWAILISASVFAAIHAHIPSLAGLFVLAVALTLVYEGAGSLWAPILMHSLFNGLTVVLTLAWPDSMK